MTRRSARTRDALPGWPTARGWPVRVGAWIDLGGAGYGPPMPKIPTTLHAAGDYANGALLLAAPRLLPIRDRRAQALAIGAGAKILTISAFTDYELGIRRRIPMPVHLLVDAVAGGLMIAAGLGLRGQRGTKLPDWLPFVLVGAGEIAAAGLTERAPKRRRGRRESAERPVRRLRNHRRGSRRRCAAGRPAPDRDSGTVGHPAGRARIRDRAARADRRELRRWRGRADWRRPRRSRGGRRCCGGRRNRRLGPARRE
jgi:hypothetical protein